MVIELPALVDDAFPIDAAAHRRAAALAVDGAAVDDGVGVLGLGALFDVALGDGAIYFTDPPYGVKREERELDFQGLYRISADGKTLSLLVKDFAKPNELAFTPDEKILSMTCRTGLYRVRLSIPGVKVP